MEFQEVESRKTSVQQLVNQFNSLTKGPGYEQAGDRIVQVRDQQKFNEQLERAQGETARVANLLQQLQAGAPSLPKARPPPLIRKDMSESSEQRVPPDGGPGGIDPPPEPHEVPRGCRPGARHVCRYKVTGSDGHLYFACDKLCGVSGQHTEHDRLMPWNHTPPYPDDRGSVTDTDKTVTVKAKESDKATYPWKGCMKDRTEYLNTMSSIFAAIASASGQASRVMKQLHETEDLSKPPESFPKPVDETWSNTDARAMTEITVPLPARLKARLANMHAAAKIAKPQYLVSVRAALSLTAMTSRSTQRSTLFMQQRSSTASR